LRSSCHSPPALCRQTRISEIIDGIAGKVQLVSGKHHVSRSMQHLIKQGTLEQKKRIFEEMKEGLATLVSVKRVQT
jgi:hypothetical protein